MSWKHRYAATRCEACGRNLTEPGSVDLVYSIAGHVSEVPSRLDSDGVLDDVDGIIAKGLHSDTSCAACGHSLSEEELTQDALQFQAREGGMYHGDELLGEFLDGRFVPSRLLLEKPVEFQKSADEFAQEAVKVRESHPFRPAIERDEHNSLD